MGQSRSNSEEITRIIAASELLTANIWGDRAKTCVS
jgi:hypothetical protein